MITWLEAFAIEKPTKRQRLLLSQPILVRDLFGQAWSIQQDTKAHLILVNWLTNGGHNDAVVPDEVCRHPDDMDNWANRWPGVEAIPLAGVQGDVVEYLVNIPHWMLLFDWSKERYTERFNDWKKGLAPPERKKVRRPRATVPATKPNPFAK